MVEEADYNDTVDFADLAPVPPNTLVAWCSGGRPGRSSCEGAE